MKLMHYVQTILLSLIIIFSASSVFHNLNIYSQTASISGADSGLAAYYSFDDGTVQGKINNGAVFDGNTSISATAPAPDAMVTIAGWIKPTSVTGTILYRGHSSCCLSYELQLVNGKLQFGMTTSPGSNPDVTVISNSSIPLNSWTHIAVTYSSANNAISLYVNGALDASGNKTGIISNSEPALSIGARIPAANYFSGSMDDLRFYTRALTSSEIGELYALGGTTVVVATPPPPPPTQNPPPTTITTGGIYYVDFESGNDSNSGAQASPWKHAPGDPNATGNPVTVFLQAGNKVIFKGGVTYYPGSSGIVIKWSGASGSPIVYDGNSQGNFGSGRAILNGNNVSTITTAFKETSAQNYYTIKNFEATNFLGSNIYGAGLLDMVETPHIGVVVDGNYVHDVGYWKNDGGQIYGGAVWVDNCDFCTISNNIIRRTGMVGVGIYGHNSQVLNNNIGEYIVWGIDINNGGYGNTPTSDILIKGNTIYDLYYQDIGYRTGLQDPHTDFIFLRGDDAQIGQPRRFISNIVVDGNFFYNNKLSIKPGGTAQIYTSNTHDVVIRNNVFINGANTAISIGLSYNVKIQNNSFQGMSALSMNDNGIAPNGIANFEITNNIFNTGNWFASAVALWTASSYKGLVMDYNYYYPASNGNLIVGNGGCGAGTSLAQWKAQTYPGCGGPYEVHGIGTDDFSAIKFAGVPASLDMANTFNAHLLDGSPGINKGVSLSGFSSDKEGTSRPQAGVWDIGAYEYTGVVSQITYVPGDFNKDGYVNSLDFSAMSSAWNTSNTLYDLNKDGTVNTLDYSIMVQNWTR